MYKILKFGRGEPVHVTLESHNIFCFYCRFGFKPFLTFAGVLILASMVTIACLVGDEDLTPVAFFDG